jgi:HD-like signal output (HDOD) protein/CheY-like chemotaxis protein
VDDELPVLNLLQTLFRHSNPEWESSFTDRGPKALALMQDQSFDVIVSDMRMPEMNGAELLEQTRLHHPRTARIVLSGYADQPMSIRSLASTHQYLAKPFTLTGLQTALNRIFGIADFVPDPDLQIALGGLHLLPSAPLVYERAVQDLQSAAANSDTLGGVLAQDVAVTAKLMQIVHSAFFGAPRPLMTAKDCAQVLGFNLLRTLVASNHFLLPSPGPEIGGLSLETLTRHSVSTGLRATRILSHERATPDIIKAAFTTGALHQIGRLALATVRPDQYCGVMRRVFAGETTLIQAERDAFGVHHGQVGAYLLGLWGLPDNLVELIANLPDPRSHRSQGFGPLAALYLASYCERSSSGLPETAFAPLDREYLAALRISPDRIEQWAQIE